MLTNPMLTPSVFPKGHCTDPSFSAIGACPNPKAKQNGYARGLRPQAGHPNKGWSLVDKYPSWFSLGEMILRHVPQSLRRTQNGMSKISNRKCTLINAPLLFFFISFPYSHSVLPGITSQKLLAPQILISGCALGRIKTKTLSLISQTDPSVWFFFLKLLSLSNQIKCYFTTHRCNAFVHTD